MLHWMKQKIFISRWEKFDVNETKMTSLVNVIILMEVISLPFDNWRRFSWQIIWFIYPVVLSTMREILMFFYSNLRSNWTALNRKFTSFINEFFFEHRTRRKIFPFFYFNSKGQKSFHLFIWELVRLFHALREIISTVCNLSIKLDEWNHTGSPSSLLRSFFYLSWPIELIFRTWKSLRIILLILDLWKKNENPADDEKSFLPSLIKFELSFDKLEVDDESSIDLHRFQEKIWISLTNYASVSTENWIIDGIYRLMITEFDRENRWSNHLWRCVYFILELK